MGILVSSVFAVGSYFAASGLGLVHSGPGGFMVTGFGMGVLVIGACLGGYIGAKIK